jgi:hypothetical protein
LCFFNKYHIFVWAKFLSRQKDYYHFLNKTMDYSLLDFLTLLGAVGIFLYGMTLMSDGLQKAAGNGLRNILGAMTRNRFTGALTGFSITALIQSSSASTVMVVSFVSAGLMTLAQSVAVIMGANVGTTATAWIITLFGFKVDIGGICARNVGAHGIFSFIICGDAALDQHIPCGGKCHFHSAFPHFFNSSAKNAASCLARYGMPEISTNSPSVWHFPPGAPKPQSDGTPAACV